MKTILNVKTQRLLGDLQTPVGIYLKVRDMYHTSALLESSDYHAGENSLSFIALCPLANIGVNSGIVTAHYPDGSRTEEPLTKTFTVEKAMNRFINQFQVTGENKNVCWLYGYTTFNAVKYFEHIPVKESHDAQNDAPDLLYILYKYVIVFNKRGKIIGRQSETTALPNCPTHLQLQVCVCLRRELLQCCEARVFRP